MWQKCSCKKPGGLNNQTVYREQLSAAGGKPSRSQVSVENSRGLSLRGDTDKKIISWFEKKFSKVASSEEELDKDAFTTAINNDQCLLKLFDLFDMDKGGQISIEELVRGVDKLTCMNKDAKWLAWLEQQFSRISGESRQISLHDFTEVLQVKEQDERKIVQSDPDLPGCSGERVFKGFCPVNRGARYIGVKYC
eukprot:sb/3470960/